MAILVCKSISNRLCGSGTEVDVSKASLLKYHKSRKKIFAGFLLSQTDFLETFHTVSMQVSIWLQHELLSQKVLNVQINVRALYINACIHSHMQTYPKCLSSKLKWSACCILSFFSYLQVRGDVLSKFIETKTLEESLKL